MEAEEEEAIGLSELLHYRLAMDDFEVEADEVSNYIQVLQVMWVQAGLAVETMDQLEEGIFEEMHERILAEVEVVHHNIMPHIASMGQVVPVVPAL